MFHIILIFTITAAKSLQSCPTLCKPRDGSYRVIGRLHETTFTNDLIQGLIA